MTGVDRGCGLELRGTGVVVFTVTAGAGGGGSFALVFGLGVVAAFFGGGGGGCCWFLFVARRCHSFDLVGKEEVIWVCMYVQWARGFCG